MNKIISMIALLGGCFLSGCAHKTEPGLLLFDGEPAIFLPQEEFLMAVQANRLAEEVKE